MSDKDFDAESPRLVAPTDVGKPRLRKRKTQPDRVPAGISFRRALPASAHPGHKPIAALVSVTANRDNNSAPSRQEDRVRFDFDGDVYRISAPPPRRPGSPGRKCGEPIHPRCRAEC